tara:strand:- start:1754 stop:2038 length:285 start_codon:yes stop_codon:yes gene_type:complete
MKKKGTKVKISKKQLRQIIKEEHSKMQGMKPEVYFGFEDKLINLLLDMEDISAEQLEEMEARLGDTGLSKVVKLLAKMALGNQKYKTTGTGKPS